MTDALRRATLNLLAEGEAGEMNLHVSRWDRGYRPIASGDLKVGMTILIDETPSNRLASPCVEDTIFAVELLDEHEVAYVLDSGLLRSADSRSAVFVKPEDVPPGYDFVALYTDFLAAFEDVEPSAV